MGVQEQQVGAYAQTPNAGQVARLKLLPVEGLLGLAGPAVLPVPGYPHTVSRNGLAVAAGAVLTELVFPAGGCSFQESSQAEAGGGAWRVALVATVPRNQAALLDWIQRHQGRRWVALWLDRNGQAYLAGEPGNGLRLEVGRTIADQNAVTVTLTGRALHAAWFLETFDPASLFADAEFDFAFDFSFTV